MNVRCTVAGYFFYKQKSKMIGLLHVLHPPPLSLKLLHPPLVLKNIQASPGEPNTHQIRIHRREQSI